MDYSKLVDSAANKRIQPGEVQNYTFTNLSYTGEIDARVTEEDICYSSKSCHQQPVKNL